MLGELKSYEGGAMALTTSNLVTTKNLKHFLTALRTAKAPERFTTRFLVQLGFKTTNDRMFIGLLKALGILDDNGAPTQRYFEFLDEGRSGKVLAQALREAYDDLFRVNVKANEASVEELKNRLKTLTQGQKSDEVVGRMAATFKTLCDLADWSETAEPKAEEGSEPPAKQRPEAEQRREAKEGEKLPPKLGPGGLGLYYNLQIILPDTRDPAVFDAIFRSIKEHLL